MARVPPVCWPNGLFQLPTSPLADLPAQVPNPIRLWWSAERFAVQRRAPKATVRCNGLLGGLIPDIVEEALVSGAATVVSSMQGSIALVARTVSHEECNSPAGTEQHRIYQFFSKFAGRGPARAPVHESRARGYQTKTVEKSFYVIGDFTQVLHI